MMHRADSGPGSDFDPAHGCRPRVLPDQATHLPVEVAADAYSPITGPPRAEPERATVEQIRGRLITAGIRERPRPSTPAPPSGGEGAPDGLEEWTQNYFPTIDDERLSTKSAAELGLCRWFSPVNGCRD
jgi:hypothetical protein